jgi:hypothetical protein
MRRAEKIFSRAAIAALAVLGLWASGCAPALVAPVDSESSLVIGRVIINNRRELALGRMPPGTIKEGILVELESVDKRTVVRVTTDEEGYFFLPNISPGAYDVRQVNIGSVIMGWRGTYESNMERFTVPQGMLSFRPAPGKVGYAGTIVVDIDERGFGRTTEAPDDAAARDYFFRTRGKTPWASREVISLRAKPAPARSFSF